MALRVEDVISVPTKAGEYQIQLCYGDITKLEEKVDIIMVSAFPGDYSPTGGTLIGALFRNLGIKVNKLAKDKAMDLRVHFSCWMSKELDNHLPYKRLMCFEKTKTGGNVINQMREMFRVFVPACGNQETTVITPLLGTGNQGFGESMVLKCMVEAAANWMHAGLPLKCIKLVIYEENNKELNKIFASLKNKIGKKFKNNSDQTEIAYDVFISYELKDEDWVNKISAVLRQKNKDIKIYAHHTECDENAVWQDKLYKTMVCCNKIIAVLTPSFVKSSNCIDQFNMAMCYNRLKNSERLYPFLISAVDSMPVYMKLVQYFDCRVRREGDVVDVKIDQACTYLLNPVTNRPAILDNEEPEERFQYDVFISYSHRHPKIAEKMLQMLTTANSDLKIFFDRSELTMGSMWQSSLYESIDKSECIVALVSSSYFTSVVCQEEYNIALARHLACPTGVLFIPVLIEDMETIPSPFSRIPFIDGRGKLFEKVTQKLTENIIQWRQDKGKSSFFPNPVDRFSFKSIENKRNKRIKKKYILDLKMKEMKPVKQFIKDLKPSNEGDVDIAISFARDVVAYGAILNNVFETINSQLQISFLNENTHGSLQDLDQAKQIVIILSKEYIQSSGHMQELHVALCRQRDTKNRKIVHIILDDNLPENPMFAHLLHCDMNLSDKVWTLYHKEAGAFNNQKTVLSHKSGLKGSFSVRYGTFFALQTVALDVVECLTRTEQTEVPPIICNILEAKMKDAGYPLTMQVNECLIDIFADNQKLKLSPIQENEADADSSQKKNNKEKVKDKEKKMADEENNEQIAADTKQETEKTDEKVNGKNKKKAIKWADDSNSEHKDTNTQPNEKETNSSDKTVVIWADDVNESNIDTQENNQLYVKAKKEKEQADELAMYLDDAPKAKSKSCILL